MRCLQSQEWVCVFTSWLSDVKVWCREREKIDWELSSCFFPLYDSCNIGLVKECALQKISHLGLFMLHRQLWSYEFQCWCNRRETWQCYGTVCWRYSWAQCSAWVAPRPGCCQKNCCCSGHWLGALAASLMLPCSMWWWWCWWGLLVWLTCNSARKTQPRKKLLGSAPELPEKRLANRCWGSR